MTSMFSGLILQEPMAIKFGVKLPSLLAQLASCRLLLSSMADRKGHLAMAGLFAGTRALWHRKALL